MEQYLKMNELTGLLRVSRATVYRLKNKGLPYIKVGKSIRFSKERVEDWLYEQKKETEKAETILQVGDYRCLGCGWVGHVERPRPLKEIWCRQCGKKRRVELANVNSS